VNKGNIVDPHSHGSGRWCDPSIADSQNLSVCRQNVEQRRAPQMLEMVEEHYQTRLTAVADTTEAVAQAVIDTQDIVQGLPKGLR
jgi:hypothetical protein